MPAQGNRGADARAPEADASETMASGGAGPRGGAPTAGTGGGDVATGGAPSAGGRTSAPDTGGPAAPSSPPDPAAIDCHTDGDGTTTLAFVNGCAETVTYRGSDIDGGELAPGAFACVDVGTDVETLSAKRYWGFVGADPGAEHHSLAEFTFNTDFNDFDWYDISFVDAFNLPMQIVPIGRETCDTLTCAEDWLSTCPPEGRFTDASGAVVACVSPQRDDPQSPVALFFEACDDAYAWSGDDQNGSDPSPMRACAGEDWDIVFCPEAAP